MRTMQILFISTLILLVNTALLAKSEPVTSTESMPISVQAVWQQHEERFSVSSFYNYYSCDGMENKVEKLLTELGAREVKARVSGCFDSSNNLGRSLNVRVKFQTLSSDTSASVEGELVTASLQNVHIRKRHPRGVSEGDCLLITRLQDKILDKFEHEVIRKNRSCFPGQQSLGDVNWKVKVLKTTS